MLAIQNGLGHHFRFNFVIINFLRMFSNPTITHTFSLFLCCNEMPALLFFVCLFFRLVYKRKRCQQTSVNAKT